jgi:hypothetical protein
MVTVQYSIVHTVHYRRSRRPACAEKGGPVSEAVETNSGGSYSCVGCGVCLCLAADAAALCINTDKMKEQ